MGEEKSDKPLSLIQTSSNVLSTRSTNLVRRGLNQLNIQQTNVLTFPPDTSIGTLYVFSSNSNSDQIMSFDDDCRYDELPFESHNAQGNVFLEQGVICFLDVSPLWSYDNLFKSSAIQRIEGISFRGWDYQWDQRIFHLAQLKWLDLSEKFYGMGDHCLMYSTLPLSLRGLRLMSTATRDNDLARLSEATNLDYLDLSDNRITDKGLMSLSGLYKLQWLRLDHNNVTPEGVSLLKKSLPNCDIRY